MLEYVAWKHAEELGDMTPQQDTNMQVCDELLLIHDPSGLRFEFILIMQVSAKLHGYKMSACLSQFNT